MSEAVFVEGLTKTYAGKTVVDHLDLLVKCGTVFGLLGANGAGKSTPFLSTSIIPYLSNKWGAVQRSHACFFLPSVTKCLTVSEGCVNSVLKNSG